MRNVSKKFAFTLSSLVLCVSAIALQGCSSIPNSSSTALSSTDEPMGVPDPSADKSMLIKLDHNTYVQMMTQSLEKVNSDTEHLGEIWSSASPSDLLDEQWKENTKNALIQFKADNQGMFDLVPPAKHQNSYDLFMKIAHINVKVADEELDGINGVGNPSGSTDSYYTFLKTVPDELNQATSYYNQAVNAMNTEGN